MRTKVLKEEKGKLDLKQKFAVVRTRFGPIAVPATTSAYMQRILQFDGLSSLYSSRDEVGCHNRFRPLHTQDSSPRIP